MGGSGGGLELSWKNPGQTAHSPETDAKSDADRGCVADGKRLRAIIERWPQLPESMKSSIVLMVEQVGKQETVPGTSEADARRPVEID